MKMIRVVQIVTLLAMLALPFAVNPLLFAAPPCPQKTPAKALCPVERHYCTDPQNNQCLGCGAFGNNCSQNELQQGLFGSQPTPNMTDVAADQNQKNQALCTISYACVTSPPLYRDCTENTNGPSYNGYFQPNIAVKCP
jgi:hypothetical protein